MSALLGVMNAFFGRGVALLSMTAACSGLARRARCVARHKHGECFLFWRNLVEFGWNNEMLCWACERGVRSDFFGTVTPLFRLGELLCLGAMAVCDELVRRTQDYL